jgi:hypothetical protein
MNHTSRFDNVHVLLWLIKDTCWMLEWKILGTAMIAPTIGVAIYLAVRSAKAMEQTFWVNLAICFWITANAYWMVCEFVERDEYKNFAGIPFSLGLISVLVFYTRRETAGLKPGDYDPARS